jgi:predicted MPP superfamily phosphohydrolase
MPSNTSKEDSTEGNATLCEAKGNFSRRRRWLLTVGLVSLVGLGTRAISFKPTQVLSASQRYGSLFDVDRAASGATHVHQNESSFVTISSAGDPAGIPQDILNAYGATRRDGMTDPYSGIDSLNPGWDYRIEMTDFDVIVPSLPPRLDGLRIALLTDVHVGQFAKDSDVRQMAAFAASLQPDLVVLTGDIVFRQESQEQLETALQYLASIPARFGIFATLGNHDHWDGAGDVVAALRTAGIPLLDNENREITPGLWLAGIDDLLAGQPDLNSTLHGIPDHAATILLSHNPNILPQVADRALVVLSGHTHGGQVRFAGQEFNSINRPNLYAHLMTIFETIGFVKRGGNAEGLGTWRYVEGWYQAEDARMYVSRGLGVVRPPYRVNCPAELTLLRLRAPA